MIPIGTTEYTKDSIESLDPREHVRLRSGVYVGDTSTPNQLLLEIFSNALDEHNIGHGNKIYVDIKEDGWCTVRDEGQGFPINETREEDGKTVLEAAFSVMNTSGKYRDDGVYQGTSLGLNGMGAKLSNFLSLEFEVESYQKGQFEHLWFKDGLFVKRETGKLSPQDKQKHGTWISYLPDPQFFDTDKTSVKFFDSFFRDICCLAPGLTVVLNDTEINQAGIDDLLTRRIDDKIELLDSRLIINHQEKSGSKFDLGLTFTADGGSSTVVPYVNFGLTNQGPHITAIKSTVTRVFNNWAKEQGLLKEKDKTLDGNSLQEGMLLVVNIVTQNVSYNAQVKTTVTKIDSSFVTAQLAKELEIWLDNNPIDGQKIIEKALVARKAAEAAKKAREAVKKKAEEKKEQKVFNLPTKLTDCWTKDRSKAELLLAEGLSAASGLVAARDSEFQAVYGLRGKCLSVLKTTPEKILANQEINNIIQALGLDCNPKTAKLTYDRKKLRYGKIVACADADPDGWAIENLLFNILWYLCPDLIIEGHVYSSVPPLYRVTTKKNEYIYLRGDAELADWKKEHPNELQILSRMKGLGECDAEELSLALLDPKTRTFYQLQVSDIGKTDLMFQNLYGKRVEPRVKFLAEHLEEAHVD